MNWQEVRSLTDLELLTRYAKQFPKALVPPQLTPSQLPPQVRSQLQAALVLNQPDLDLWAEATPVYAAAKEDPSPLV